MSIIDKFRIFFELVGLFRGLLIIIARNPIHSVFSLILFVCAQSILLFVIGCDLVAFVLLIVYVGAVTVLFLFVVMMLNIKISEIHTFRVLSYSLFLFFVFSVVCFLAIIWLYAEYPFEYLNYIDFIIMLETVGNLDTMGAVLYTYYAFPFIILSVVLFFIMVVTICIVLHANIIAKRQSITEQVARNIIGSIRLKYVGPHSNEFDL